MIDTQPDPAEERLSTLGDTPLGYRYVSDGTNGLTMRHLAEGYYLRALYGPKDPLRQQHNLKLMAFYWLVYRDICRSNGQDFEGS